MRIRFIGTKLVKRFLDTGGEVLNIDIAEPRNRKHLHLWRRVDLLDREAMIDVFRSYKPDVVLHMAARTDLHESRSIKCYAANTDGVANVIEAVRRMYARQSLSRELCLPLADSFAR